MLTVRDLRHAYAQPGRLTWIGLRPARAEPLRVVSAATLVADRGLEGDRAARVEGGKRQVSLIQQEHLAAVACLLGRDAPIDPALLRRNLVIAGFNLLALHKRQFSLGDALLEWTGHAHPCSRMEQALGPGGYTALRGHGGILARVLRGGHVKLGDTLVPLPAEEGE